MTADDHGPDVAALEAALNQGDDLEWHAWRGPNGGAGIFHAWLIEPVVSPPVVLYDRSANGLRARCAEFERAWAADGFADNALGRARAAAERLQTGGS